MQDGSAVPTNGDGTSPSCHQVGRWRWWRQRCDTKLKVPFGRGPRKAFASAPSDQRLWLVEAVQNSYGDEAVSSDLKERWQVCKGLRAKMNPRAAHLPLEERGRNGPLW